MTGTHPDLLKSLPADTAQAVLALAGRFAVPAGAVLFPLGATAEQLFVIERGRINLTLPMEVYGREEDILVEERSAGQTVGWSALIPPHRFTLKATAQIDTDLFAFPQGALQAHLAAHPEVGYQVMTNLAATVGQRLQVFQAMWLREMKRGLERSGATGSRA